MIIPYRSHAEKYGFIFEGQGLSLNPFNLHKIIWKENITGVDANA